MTDFSKSKILSKESVEKLEKMEMRGMNIAFNVDKEGNASLDHVSIPIPPLSEGGIVSKEQLDKFRFTEGCTIPLSKMEKFEHYDDIDEYHEGLDRLLKSLNKQKKSRIKNIKGDR